MQIIQNQLGKLYANSYLALAPLYNGPMRVYHNLHHIDTMLSEPLLDTIKLEATMEQSVYGVSEADLGIALTLSILFHDSYYCATQPGWNEQMSAANLLFQFSSYCDTAIDGQDLRTMRYPLMLEAADAIKRTEHHTQTQHDVEPNSIASWLLDIDLGGLGASRLRYLLNTRLIAREYMLAGVGVEQFIRGRVVFLTKMLHRGEQLFYNDAARAKWHANADSNMRDELAYFEEMIDGHKLTSEAYRWWWDATRAL